MRLTRLDLTNFRGLRESHITFDERMTVFVGENGVGKSSVLDATRTLITKLWRELGVYKGDNIYFTDRDITLGENVMEVRLAFVLNGQACQLTAVERGKNVYDNPDYEGGLTQKGKEEASIEVGDRDLLVPDPKAVASEAADCAPRSLLRRSQPRPLALFYSPHRSLFVGEKMRRTVVENLSAAPFLQALKPRPLQLRELATWWASEAYIATLGTLRAAQAARTLDAMRTAARRAVDTITDLDVREHEDKPPTLVATKEGTPIDVRWLSDGERSLLALVLDITRRLAQNQPHLRDPVKNGEAVVLIDELDLHLHPSWQKRIPGMLTTTFEKCQFVCTTHSPLIIGETEPQRVMLLGTGQPEVPSASQSFGLDANLVLRWVMGEQDVQASDALQLIREAHALLDEAETDEDLERVLDVAERLRRVQRGTTPDVIEIESAVAHLRALADDADDHEE